MQCRSLLENPAQAMVALCEDAEYRGQLSAWHAVHQRHGFGALCWLHSCSLESDGMKVCLSAASFAAEMLHELLQAVAVLLVTATYKTCCNIADASGRFSASGH